MVHEYVEKVVGIEPVIAPVDESPVIEEEEEGWSVKQRLVPP